MPGTAKVREWMSKDEAAAELGITEGQVRRHVHSGRLTAERREGVLYVKAAQVSALKTAREAGTSLPAKPVMPPELQAQLAEALRASQKTPAQIEAPTPAQIEAPKREPEEEEPVEKRYTPEPRRPPRALSTIAEAVRYFGVKRKWLLENVRKGRIPAVNFGTADREDWRVDRDRLMESVRALLSLERNG